MATVEKLENSKVKFTVEIGKEAFSEALQQAYIKTKSKYNIPGFRKGKAPRKVIESMYGEGVFFEDAFELVYGDAYDKAVEDLKIEPVDRPDVSIESIGLENGIVFTAEVAVKPEVSLGAYKGIEVVSRAYTVEDAQIDAIIDQEREKVARFVEMERPVEQGDRVLLDYSGSVDGVKFDGGTAEDQTLDIGSGKFIPGFEDQLVGMNKGEEKSITVTFPEDYHAEELKGKAAVFEVTIKGIQKKELPELDDEFAKDISEFDTLAELRADKRTALEKRNSERAKAEMEDEAIRKASENAKFEVPNAMIERQMDYMLQDLAYRLSMSGLKLEDYCKYMGMDARTLRDGYRAEADQRVRTQLVLEAVAKAENIEATEEDMEQELADYVSRAGSTLEEFKATLKEDDYDYFRERIQVRKTIDVIMANAVFTEKPAEDGEKSEQAGS
jgi:trigger factor